MLYFRDVKVVMQLSILTRLKKKVKCQNNLSVAIFCKYIMNFLNKIMVLGVFLSQINGRDENSVLPVLGKERWS